MFSQFAYLSVNNKIKAKQKKRQINLISAEHDMNNVWVYTFTFLFTWLSHALHCTKLFLFFTMMLITTVFIFKALLLWQVTFLKLPAELSIYWLMEWDIWPLKNRDWIRSCPGRTESKSQICRHSSESLPLSQITNHSRDINVCAHLFTHPLYYAQYK